MPLPQARSTSLHVCLIQCVFSALVLIYQKIHNVCQKLHYGPHQLQPHLRIPGYRFLSIIGATPMQVVSEHSGVQWRRCLSDMMATA